MDPPRGSGLGRGAGKRVPGTGRVIRGVLALLCLLLVPPPALAEEVRLLGVSGVEGNVSGRLFFDDYTTSLASGASGANQQQFVTEEEVDLLVRSYLYHPNLLRLDVGGGVLLLQETFEEGTQERKSRDTLYNGRGQAEILGQKPYPQSLFFEQTNYPVSPGVAFRYYVTDRKYGFRSSLLRPIVPGAIRVGGYRQTRDGETVTQVTDEETAHLDAEILAESRDRGNLHLSYRYNRLDSANGNPQFPIVENRTTTHSGDLSGRLSVGRRKEGDAFLYASYFRQIEFPRRTDFRVQPELLWRPVEPLDLFLKYGFRQDEVEGGKTRDQEGRAGFRHRLYRSLFTSADVHGSDSRTDGSDDRIYGAKGDVSYRKRTFFGGLEIHYGAAYDIRDRSARVPEIPVFGESVVLVGLLPSELANEFVLLDSVVVSNQARTQIYVRDLDYRLTVVGTRTRVERLLGSNIADGETVLVDYSYATSGTFQTSLLDQTYGGTVDLFSYLSLFARFREAPQKLRSGVPDQPINSISSRHFGAQLFVPVRGFLLGGLAEYENHEEDISPYRRQSYSASLQVPLGASTAVVLSGRRTLQDNRDSPEDVDLAGGGVRIESRLFGGLRISAEGNYEEDTGPTLPRRLGLATFIAEWRVAKLLLRGEGRISREEQGEFEADRATVKMELRRDF